MQTFKFSLLAAVATIALWAQPPDQPLTNAQIESMLSAGLPESTILLKIRIAADRELVDVDTSSQALGILKEKGASERILNAILWAEPFDELWRQEQAAWEQMQQEERAVPGLPAGAGLYLKESSGWVPLSSFLFWAPLYSGSSWLHGSHKYSVPLDKAHSAFQITESRPNFYVREPASDQSWQIIHLSSRDDQRQVRMAWSDKWDNMDRIQPNQVIDVPMAHVAGDIFVLTPNAALEAGEYLLCTTLPEQASLNLCYSFGVRH